MDHALEPQRGGGGPRLRRLHLATFSDATIGVLYQNDESGQGALAALREGIAGRFEIIAQPYNIGDPTVDAQIAALQAAGADVFVNMSIASYASQSIRRAAELRWQPYRSASIAEVLEPAGLDNAIGIVSLQDSIDPADPGFTEHPGLAEFVWFIENSGPRDEYGVLEAYAYNVASALVEVLRRCGDDLSRENVMRQAANLADLELPMLMPGVMVDTSPTDYAPIEQFRIARFDGRSFVPFGALLDSEN